MAADQEKIIFHKHHIVPKHIGGTNDRDNIIKVNISLHAFLHKLLWEEHKNEKDRIAWLGLSKQIEKSEIHLMLVSLPRSEETKQKMSESRMGNVSGFKGKTHSDKSKKEMRQKKLGKEPWNKGKKGMQNPWNKGKKTGPRSEETKQKLSERTTEYWERKKGNIQ